MTPLLRIVYSIELSKLIQSQCVHLLLTNPPTRQEINRAELNYIVRLVGDIFALKKEMVVKRKNN